MKYTNTFVSVVKKALILCLISFYFFMEEMCNIPVIPMCITNNVVSLFGKKALVI